MMITRIELFDDLDLEAASMWAAQVHATFSANNMISPLRIVTKDGRKFLETDNHKGEWRNAGLSPQSEATGGSRLKKSKKGRQPRQLSFAKKSAPV